MADTGTPTPGGEHGAKISDTKSGCITKMAPAPSPKTPEQPVRH